MSFVIDGMTISPEQIESQAFHLTLQEGESVVLIRASSQWNVELLDRCLPAVSEAIGQRALAPHLRLLLAHIGREELIGSSPSESALDISYLANLLQLPPSSAISARATLSAGLERQIPWIQAAVHYAIGPEAASEFEEAIEGGLSDSNLVAEVLTKILVESPFDTETLLGAARSALGPADLRESLSLDFAGFNESLVALGLEPEVHPDLHRLALETFVRQRELDITDCLRASLLEKLEGFQRVDGYSTLRDGLRTLEPDDDWLLRFKEPPDTELERYVNAWLAEKDAPPLGTRHVGLSPVGQVRDHNRKFVPDFLQRALPLVRAWVSKFQPDERLEMEPDLGVAEEIRRRLDDAAVMDFRVLDDMSTAKWLRVLGLWPAGMPLSLNREELDLSEEDVTDESVKEREEKEARKREARLVSFNGKVIDPKDVDLLELAGEIEEALPPSLLGKALGSATTLEEIRGDKREMGRGGRKSASHKGKRRRIPEEKTELIGRLGELIVYHWLRKILPNQDIDAAWMSENGALVTGRKGDDGLGYDFEVSYRNQIWQIEVKASVDDPQSFEMGETEVRAARRAARARSGIQYKVAYVSHVSESEITKIEVLPNPMTEEGAKFLELRGEGIRYGFARSK